MTPDLTSDSYIRMFSVEFKQRAVRLGLRNEQTKGLEYASVVTITP